MAKGLDEGERAKAEELLADLVRWERFFDAAGAESDVIPARDEDDVRLGLSGSGVLLTRFVCRFGLGRLEVDCENVIAAGETDGRDDPRWLDALATVRLAILLVRAELDGTDWLPDDPEATVRVRADEEGASFAVVDAGGEVRAAEEGWDGLIRILERPPEDGMVVIRV